MNVSQVFNERMFMLIRDIGASWLSEEAGEILESKDKYQALDGYFDALGVCLCALATIDVPTLVKAFENYQDSQVLRNRSLNAIHHEMIGLIVDFYSSKFCNQPEWNDSQIDTKSSNQISRFNSLNVLIKRGTESGMVHTSMCKDLGLYEKLFPSKTSSINLRNGVTINKFKQMKKKKNGRRG